MTFRSIAPKLADSQCHGIGSGAELFIVEGDSASRSVRRARSAATQAVLPMQGKPLNACKASRSAVARYELYVALIESLGTGWDHEFDLRKLRYDRVILLFDPDADGIHCSALMLMFFYRWMRPILEASRVCVIRAPLFAIHSTTTDERIDAYSTAQFQKLREQLTNKQVGYTSLRYRGLASIGERVLYETCINPETRNQSTLGVDDAESAIKIFNTAPSPAD